MKAEYSAICSTEVPISSQYLFGDDLAKQLQDAKEASKISYSVASTSKYGPYKGKQHSSNQHDRYNKGPNQERFFMERPQWALQKEKITKQREKVMEQPLQINDEVSGFEPFLPTLLTYLQNLCNSFKAGQGGYSLCSLRTLTSDGIVLSDVLGASIECIATPAQHRMPNQAFSESECPIVCHEVHKLVGKGVITKASPMPGQILSSIFLRPKKDGSF